jgi:uncharacterized protein GlcG (DUF336 family)
MQITAIFTARLIAGFIAVAGLAQAQTPPANNDATRKTQQPAAHGPTLESALEVAQAAVEACEDKDNQHVAASVVDTAGVLKVLLAADGASERGVLSSTSKALTSLQFKAPTSELFKQQEVDKAFAKQLADNPKLNARPGGVLLRANGEIIGAIGVGGGKTDEECALTAVNKIEARP